MSASISTKSKNIGMEFLKKTAGYITGAAGEYIEDVIPITSSTISSARNSMSELQMTFSNTTSSILPRVRQLNIQSGFRSISNWFLQREDDSELFGDADSQLDFDVDTGTTEIATAQISEIAKNANQVSSAVIESSHKLVESQIAATANMLTSIDRQTAVISSGFDNTNATLGKILEVLTRNSATLIEATVAASSKRNESYNDNMLSSGKFNMDQYKKMVGKNFNNSELGMVTSMLPLIVQMGKGLTPQDVIKFGIGAGIDKAAPNLKKNMKAVDDAISDTIMTSLIRLGERKNDFGPMGIMAKLFGLDSTRKTTDTRRSELEVKSISFDTVAKEAITSAIPGYLRKILVAVGGNDVIYDYRSRSFKTGSQIKKDYQEVSAGKYNIYSASKGIQKAVGNDDFGSMLYDLMMNELGSRAGANGDAREIVDNFQKKGSGFTEDFIMSKVLRGIPLSKQEKERAKQIAENLSVATDGFGAGELMNQVSRNNVSRNERTSRYVNQADTYGMDLSAIRDSAENDAKSIAGAYGKIMVRSANSDVSSKGPNANLNGVNYTNMALYEIYRRLNEGINVFQVGSKELRDEPFKKLSDDYLTKPSGYRPKSINDVSNKALQSLVSTTISGDDSSNQLVNQVDEDGISENLTKSQRLARWGKKRGGNLAKAVFSGSTEDVRDAFGLMMKDITEVAGAEAKKGVAHINSSFGNVSGFLKHKMFGTEYSYQTGVDDKGKPIIKQVPSNEKKGIFGWIKDGVSESFANAKKNSTKWLSSVKGYFDFGDDEKDPSEKGVSAKRKKLLITTAGAFAGAGILGGPLGLIVGSIAGNALSGLGIGKRIKETLFGHDDKGKPTGLLTKAADAILSPIKFQLGKTISLAGGVLKKHIFGPMADIGLALKDRIYNHVDSAFKKATDFLLSPFKKLGKMALGGLANLAGKAAIGLSNLGTTTLPGKFVRGAMTIGGGIAGGLQTGVAKSIGKNSFHTLKKDEEYVIKAGKAYMGKDGKKHYATEDMTVTGKDGIKVSTNDYNSLRRKSREKEVEQDLSESGYYQSGRGVLGRVKGFFGGDYNKWHEQDLLRRQNRRSKLSEYLAEGPGRESSGEDTSIRSIVESTEETKENTSEISETLKETNTATEEISEVSKATNESVEHLTSDIGSLSSAIIGEIIPGSSFKSHDAGVHDRLDTIISFLLGGTGSIQESEGVLPAPISQISELSSPIVPSIEMPTGITDTSKSSEESEIGESRNFAESIIGASASITAASGDVSDEETKETVAIAKSGMSENPSKETLLSRFQNLISFNKKNKKTENNDEVEKESGLSRVMNFAGGILGGAANILSGLPDGLSIIAPAVLGIALLKKLGISDQIIGWFKDTAMPWITDTAIPGIANFIKQDIVPAVTEIAPTIVKSVVEIAGAIWKEVPPWLQVSLVGLAAAKGIDAIGTTVSGVKTLIGGISKAVSWASGAASAAGATASATAAVSSGGALLTSLGSAAAAAAPIALPLLAAAGIGAAIYQATAPSDAMKAQEDFVELSDGTVIGRESWEKGLLPDSVKNNKELMEEFDQKRQEANWGLAGISEERIGNRRGWDAWQNFWKSDDTNSDDKSLMMDAGDGVKSNLGQILEDWDTLSAAEQEKLIKEMHSQKMSMFLGTEDSIALKAFKLGLKANGDKIENIREEKADAVTALLFDLINRETGEGYPRNRGSLANPVGTGYLRDQFRLFDEMKEEERDKYIKMLEDQLDGFVKEASIKQYVQKSFEDNYKYAFGQTRPDLYESVNSSTISGYESGEVKNVGGGEDEESNQTTTVSQPKADSSAALPSPFLGGGFKLSAGPLYSQYGWRNLDAKYGGPGFHKGIDLAPTAGDGSIGAVAPGKVTKISNSVTTTKGGKGFGNFVEYETADGTKIINAHMAPSSIPPDLQVNSTVSPGDKIGKMGTTGNSSGNHLHFEVSNNSFPGDGHNGHTTDPAPLLGAKTLSDTGKFVSAASSGMISGSSDWSGNSNINGETGETGESGKSGFALFIERLKAFGNKLLYRITGGALGSLGEEAEASVSSNISPEYDYRTADGQQATLSGAGPNSAVSQLDPEVEIELLTNSQVDAIMRSSTVAVVLDLKSGISYQIIWGGPPKTTHTDYTPLTPTDTEKKKSAVAYDSGMWPDWSPRPCILKMAGHQIAIGTHNYPHGNRMPSSNPGESMPDLENKKVDNEWPLGGHFCMYYKDSTKNNNGTDENASEHQKSAQEAYNIATAMIEKLKKSQEAAAKVKDSDKSSLWAYLKTKGFSDTAISGILGCWDAESKNTAKTIESDFLVPGGGPDYDKLISDRQAMNDYTENVVFAKNPNIEKKWYRGEDNNWYPGIGYAQWTGTRGQQLLEYAKSKGQSWAAPVTQLDFMDQELRDTSSYYGPNRLNVIGELAGSNTPEAAARVWALKYEGAHEYHLPPRVEAAKKLYSEYSGKFDELAQPPPEEGGDSITGGGGGYGGGPASTISNVQSSSRSRIPSPKKTSGGFGGGGSSNIGSTKFKSKSFTPKGVGGKPASTISSKTSGSLIGSTSDFYEAEEGFGGAESVNLPNPVKTGSKTQQVEMLLGQVVELLRSINSNTGESSDLLETLNQKDFVDKGLRDSISSLPKSKKKTPTPYNHGNTRTISSMARP